MKFVTQTVKDRYYKGAKEEVFSQPQKIEIGKKIISVCTERMYITATFFAGNKRAKTTSR